MIIGSRVGWVHFLVLPIFHFSMLGFGFERALELHGTEIFPNSDERSDYDCDIVFSI